MKREDQALFSIPTILKFPAKGRNNLHSRGYFRSTFIASRYKYIMNNECIKFKKDE